MTEKFNVENTHKVKYTTLDFRLFILHVLFYFRYIGYLIGFVRINLAKHLFIESIFFFIIILLR